MIINEMDYATVTEAAQLLRVSVPTVWRWIDSGKLRAYRVGGRSIRIRKSDLASVVHPARATGAGFPSVLLGDRALQREALTQRLVDGQRKILARRRGRVLKSSAPLIRRARRERTARL